MNRIYGYARISTTKQNIERQIRNIKAAYPDAIVFEEIYTGSTADRTVFQKLIDKVKAGDTIVFDSVSRMSRNAETGAALYADLYNRGINLVFVREPHINTAVYEDSKKQLIAKTDQEGINYILEGINKYLMHLSESQIKLAFEQAEKEVVDLRQRTKEGVETARINGKQIGRQKGELFTTNKEKTSKEIIIKHSKDFGGSLKDVEVMKLCNISRNSYYKYKRALKNG